MFWIASSTTTTAPLAARHQSDRGMGTLQGQSTRSTFNGPYGG